MALAGKRTKDQEMSKRLAPAPERWRGKPETWPYHNNLGTIHDRAKREAKESKKGA